MKPSLAIALCLAAALIGAIVGYFSFPYINSTVQSGNTSHPISNQTYELQQALLNGDKELLKMLISQDLDLNVTDENGQTPIFVACREGHADIVSLLAKNDVDVNHQDNQGDTPLFIAIQNHKEDVFDTLIKNDAKVNLRNRFGTTAIHIAADLGLEYIVKRLIEKGANINSRDNNFDSPFVLALRKGHKHVADILIGNRKFNPNSPDVGEATDTELEIDEDVIKQNWMRSIKNAVYQGDEAFSEILINNYANYLEGMKESWLMHIAAENGTGRIVTALAKNGLDVGLRDARGMAAIHCAAATGKANVIKVLVVENEDDVNRRDHKNWTPLLYAAFNNREEAVKTLLNLNASISLVDDFNRTALHHACHAGHKNILKVFIKQIGFAEVLKSAASDGHESIVKWIIENGLDDSLKVAYKFTPITWATKNQYGKLVQALVEKGTDINARGTGTGDTALVWAISQNNLDLAKFLIEHGADVRMKSSYGSSALDHAVKYAKNEAVKLLLENGAEVNELNGLRTSPLFIAVATGNVEITKLLIEHGAEIVYGNCNPLDRLACEDFSDPNYREIWEILLEKGANVNSEDDKGSSMIQKAAATGHEETVKILLKNGADVNHRNKLGESALHAACKNGSENIVKLLIQNNADVNIQNNNEETALQIAKTNGHHEIVEILNAKLAD